MCSMGTALSLASWPVDILGHEPACSQLDQGHSVRSKVGAGGSQREHPGLVWLACPAGKESCTKTSPGQGSGLTGTCP